MESILDQLRSEDKECHAIQAFASKIQPLVDELTELGYPVEIVTISCTGGKRRWFKASPESIRSGFVALEINGLNYDPRAVAQSMALDGCLPEPIC
jgi:hypothetical protein